MDAGSCNACSAAGTPLMKFSLGKDFFGRTYDRLSPSSDQSPKWYCEPCSMMKNLQRDFRDIRAEFDKLTSSLTSILTAVGSAMREVHQDKSRAKLAEQATGWVKPLVMMTAGVINGASEADVEEIMAN